MSAYGIMKNGSVVKLEYPKNVEETIDWGSIKEEEFFLLEESRSYTKEDWLALMDKILIVKNKHGEVI